MIKNISKEDIDKAWDMKMENSHKLSKLVIGKNKNKYEKLKLKVRRLIYLFR